jgi:serine/threonine protein kinase
MALAIDTRFGSYEITDRLGVGGMGEVYRATDTALKRDVAVKVLPESFANDAERLARFQREAEVLASLNHSNIAQIYGLEKADDQTVIVMELVEGPTLADRIAQGPVPADEALDIATQIANALEAAHERGIVHRDLKPANIKLRADGVVKVLDFGIAKAVEPPLTSSGAAAPVLSTPAMTETGVILGTAEYMSPEQARGKALDGRTDIWAFGVVLFEMLTGQPAFAGEDVTDTVAAVLKSEPDWSLLPELPPLVLTFLKQCLRKEPKDRPHHIVDVRLALAEKYETAHMLPATATDGAMARRRSGIGWALAGLVGVALGSAGVGLWNSEPSPAGSSMTIRQLTFRQGAVGGARFASDGQVIVYGAAWNDEPYRLYTTRLDGYQSRPMDLAPADLLAVS